MQTIDIIRIKNGVRTQLKDEVASEEVLTLFLNEKPIAKFNCLGLNINELITGYLYYNEYITDYKEINSFDYNIQNKSVHISIKKMESSVDKSSKPEPKKYAHKNLISLMDTFSTSSDTYQRTGTAHSAGIATENEIIKTFEDLSRHNTLYMLLGYSLINNVLLSDKILLLTCRLTYTIMQIIKKTNTRMIMTNTAPTYLTVNFCRENDITLAGFVRENRMNIYNGAEWIS